MPHRHDRADGRSRRRRRRDCPARGDSRIRGLHPPALPAPHLRHDAGDDPGRRALSRRGRATSRPREQVDGAARAAEEGRHRMGRQPQACRGQAPLDPVPLLPGTAPGAPGRPAQPAEGGARHRGGRKRGERPGLRHDPVHDHARRHGRADRATRPRRHLRHRRRPPRRRARQAGLGPALAQRGLALARRARGFALVSDRAPVPPGSPGRLGRGLPPRRRRPGGTVMADPVVHGAAYSVYVRIVRLTLEEKGVAYRLAEVDVFAPDGPPDEHMRRHPFGKIPVFEHDGFSLYETGAIARYIDEAFAGPSLVPADARSRARMNQIIGVLDAYAYPAMVWGVYVEAVAKPAEGVEPVAGLLERGLERSRTVLQALDGLMIDGGFPDGAALSLADLHAAPMFAYFAAAPAGAAMIADHPRLAAWCDRMAARQSMMATRPPQAAW